MMGRGRAVSMIAACLVLAELCAAEAPKKDPKRHWSRTPFAITMAEEALPADQLPKVVQGHPRMLIRAKPWKGGISVPELRRRARRKPWAKWVGWCGRKKPKPNQWRPVRALYYLASEDETVVPKIIDYVLAAKPAYNCGGGLVDVAIQYDWIYNSPSVTDELRKHMADRIAKVAFECARIYESGWAFDLWSHRASPGWASDVLAAALVLDDDHPAAEKLRRWAMGYWKRNYFRAWQHNDGCWLHGGSSYNIGLILPRAIACWASATAEDVYGLIRRDYGDWLANHMYYMMAEVLPDKTRSDAIAWDYNPPGLRMPSLNCLMISRAYANPDSYAYLRWLGRSPKCDPYGGLMHVLFYDESLEAARPTIRTDAPWSKLWGPRGAGYAQMRSKGWAPDSTVIEFKCGDWIWPHTHTNHSNSFWIFHKGRLAVQGGIYDSYGGNHVNHYYARSISGNTVLVYRPGEFARGYRVKEDAEDGVYIPEPGGQRMHIAMGQTSFTFDEFVRRKTQPNATGELFEAGDVTAFEHADDYAYTYLCGDATMAYNNPRFCFEHKGRKNKPKLDLFTRSLAWLDNKHLVVFDRVRALEAGFRKVWLCHFQGTPRVAGRLVRADVPGHIETFDGDTVEMTWSDGVCKPPDPCDPGRLFIRTFLPAEHRITRIGGKGYEFWSNGKNRPPKSSKGGRQDMGNWRIEVTPAKPAKFDNFLHLLYPCDTRTKAMPASRHVASAGGKMAGVALGGWVVMFGRTGEVAGEVSYAAPAGRAEHLVVDLKRGAAYRLTGIAGGGRTMKASESGTLRFATAGAGTVRLAPVE